MVFMGPNMKFEMVMLADVELDDELAAAGAVVELELAFGVLPPQAARSRAPATSRTPAPLLNRMRMAQAA